MKFWASSLGHLLKDRFSGVCFWRFPFATNRMSRWNKNSSVRRELLVGNSDFCGIKCQWSELLLILENFIGQQYLFLESKANFGFTEHSLLKVSATNKHELDQFSIPRILKIR